MCLDALSPVPFHILAALVGASARPLHTCSGLAASRPDWYCLLMCLDALYACLEWGTSSSAGAEFPPKEHDGCPPIPVRTSGKRIDGGGKRKEVDDASSSPSVFSYPCSACRFVCSASSYLPWSCSIT